MTHEPKPITCPQCGGDHIETGGAIPLLPHDGGMVYYDGGQCLDCGQWMLYDLQRVTPITYAELVRRWDEAKRGVARGG